MLEGTTQAAQDAVKAGIALPAAAASDVIGFAGQLIQAVLKVFRDGLTEHLDLRVSIFGRRIGVSCEVSLLDQAPKPGA